MLRARDTLNVLELWVSGLLDEEDVELTEGIGQRGKTSVLRFLGRKESQINTSNSLLLLVFIF